VRRQRAKEKEKEEQEEQEQEKEQEERKEEEEEEEEEAACLLTRDSQSEPQARFMERHMISVVKAEVTAARGTPRRRTALEPNTCSHIATSRM
jgi:hypothetical protein